MPFFYLYYKMIKRWFISFSLGAILLATSCSINENKDTSENIKTNTRDKYPHELLDTMSNAFFVFYNVENLFDTIDDPEKKDEDFLPSSDKKWNTKRYLDKLNKLSKVITHDQPSNPIFIGFAEVENRFVVRDLTKTGRLAQTKYRLAHFDSPDVRGIDVALAFDHDRFHMTYKEAIPIRLADNPDYKTRDILYVKGVFYDSSEIHLFVNHWSSRRGGQKESEYKRVRAAKVLKGYVDSLQAIDQQANIIVMGDFNDYPSNRSVYEVLGAKEMESEADLVNLMTPYHDRGEGTHNYRGEWGALDQLIVSKSMLDGKGLDINNKKVRILYDEEFLYTKKDGSKTPNRTYGGNSYFGGYSDHLAISATIEIR